MASFDIQGCNGGGATLTGASPDAYSRAVPLDSQTLYLVDPWGAIAVWTAPGTLVYSTSTLGQALRPGGGFLAAVTDDSGASSLLVTDDGRTTLPFGAPWGPPVFSPDGRYALFEGLPTLFDLVGAAEYTLIVNPASASFSPQSDAVLIVGVDGTLALVDLTTLPAPEALDAHQPVGALMEGTAVTAATFTPDGTAVIYAGQDPQGRRGIFLISRA